MNTHILTQRYALPAFIAAVIHAALFALVVPPMPAVSFTAPAPAPPKLPPIPADLFFTPPPPQPTADNNAVRPLSGGGTPRPTAEEIVTTLQDWNSQPYVPNRGKIVPMITEIPRDPWGPGDGVGPANWEVPGTPWVGAIHLDRTPRALAQPAPDYPMTLRRDGIEGNAMIEFDVDTSGRVVAARVLQGTHREFEDAALRAVWKWRFEPGRRDGRVVPFRMAVPVGFTISAD